MNKEYNMTLGLTREEVNSILNGKSIKFHFLPNDETDYDQKITISIGKVDNDATLSECMDLVVGNFRVLESEELSLTGLS